MVKNDIWIEQMALQGMITPFESSLKGDGRISFGAGSYGYDMRLSDEFKIPKFEGLIDPKNPPAELFVSLKANYLDIEPNSYVLGRSLEYFKIPRDVHVICFGKSTYARCGVLVNITPLEPEWEGFVTISISNTSRQPVRIYALEGIAQLVFLQASEVCKTSYKDKAGKYQAQKDITLSKL